MTTKIGINGFGRIGRQVLRAVQERHSQELEVVAVNDLTDIPTNAHMLQWDSTYGKYPCKVEAAGDSLTVDGKSIRVFAERDPAQIPWSGVGAQIVVESTGVFTDAEKAAGHIRDTVKKVIISAPAKNEDLTVVLGVNDYMYDPAKHHVLSNASCTTNCIAPVVKVLHESFGLVRGLMSTIHAYTNDQKILDQFHDDLRRARAAGMNIIPTTTGAARAVTMVIPEVKGRIHGMAFRVPVATGSVCDFVADLDHKVTAEEVNAACKQAAEGPLKGILEYTEQELVSSDFIGNSHSSVFDAPSTLVLDDSMVKVLSWYDNEWGYSCRVSDLAVFLAGKGL
ncbi:MAG: type I glyceraldehyde-3-phosphate dehydrogenase [Dehalococcoidia bacterium]|nr:type I glyceraldehyde-3-phosphate dehydrogenase [Dehalococcoidia bacterium]